MPGTKFCATSTPGTNASAHDSPAKRIIRHNVFTLFATETIDRFTQVPLVLSPKVLATENSEIAEEIAEIPVYFDHQR